MNRQSREGKALSCSMERKMKPGLVRISPRSGPCLYGQWGLAEGQRDTSSLV